MTLNKETFLLTVDEINLDTEKNNLFIILSEFNARYKKNQKETIFKLAIYFFDTPIKFT
jgi:hypothetical protein